MLEFLRKKKVKNDDPYITKVSRDYEDVTPVADYFQTQTGVVFDKQLSILKNKVTSFCMQRDIDSFARLLQSVDEDISLKQQLIDHLTTNETYFYREFKQIEDLVSLVKEQSTPVEILCAPCATGEEPYSIAIALLEFGVDGKKFHITGVDINQDAIRKAKEAAYKERNIKKLSPKILERYFVKEKERYLLSRNIKDKVTFRVINIFDPAFKNMGKFDYIFSRNMLIYFDKETKQKAKEILESLRKKRDQKIFFGHADFF